jgi:hypothetical protein
LTLCRRATNDRCLRISAEDPRRFVPAFLLRASLERGSGSAQLPSPAGSPAEIHYGPGEDIKRIDVALLREAATQIDGTLERGRLANNPQEQLTQSSRPCERSPGEP